MDIHPKGPVQPRLKHRIPASAGASAQDAAGSADQRPSAEGAREAPSARRRKLAPTFEKILQHATIDLIAQARSGEFSSIVGRDQEIDRLVEHLQLRSQQLVLIAGPVGSGRLAVIHGAAARIAAGQVDGETGQRPLLLVRPDRVLGRFETKRGRVEASHLVDAAIATASTLVVHGLKWKDGRDHPLVEELNTRCAEPGFRAVLVQDVPVERLDHDPRLTARLGCVAVRPVAREHLHDLVRVHISKALGPRTRFANPRIIDELIALATTHDRLTDMPDLAVEAADLAAVRADRRAESIPRRVALVRQTFAQLAAIGPEPVPAAERHRRLEGMAGRLQARVIGQGHVIDEVVDRLTIGAMGFRLRPNRPVGAFLLSGPTGVGKTELARALADELGGGPGALVRLDMSEYSTERDVWKILSPPPGIVGHGQPSPFLAAVRRQPKAVVLFDEIEKAHPAIHRLLLQVLDEGHLTDSTGEPISFTQSVIVLTTNVRARSTSRSLGFAATSSGTQSADGRARALQSAFAPELLGRMDATCAFRDLGLQDSRRIVRDVLLPRWQAHHPRLDVRVSDSVIDELARRGHSEELGARHLEATVERDLLLPLAREHARSGAVRMDARAQSGTIAISAGSSEPTSRRASIDLVGAQ
ncbi:AAA family ATPase [Paraconexibacter algicola]|uniref:AAA family ATPase n=1 Tax=Paraconexibacter algicola TaxID=2133960 RepID=UPI001304FC0B|nr:AAA family ATPase [Paraconexibacter algicola]